MAILSLLNQSDSLITIAWRDLFPPRWPEPCWMRATPPAATRSWCRSRSLKRRELRQSGTVSTERTASLRPSICQTNGGDGGWVSAERRWAGPHWGRRGAAAGSWPRGCRPPAAWGARPCVCPRWRCGRSLSRSSQSCCPRNRIL